MNESHMDTNGPRGVLICSIFVARGGLDTVDCALDRLAGWPIPQTESRRSRRLKYGRTASSYTRWPGLGRSVSLAQLGKNFPSLFIYMGGQIRRFGDRDPTNSSAKYRPTNDLGIPKLKRLANCAESALITPPVTDTKYPTSLLENRRST